MIKDGINEIGNEIRSFLMVGQSNMAGRGDSCETEPIKNELCYVLRMGRWQIMREPINPDRGVFDGGTRSGISLGASFADEMSRFFEGKVGLIPAADGGTSINLWQPGEPCHDYALLLGKYAMRGSRISGIIWHQGESDSKPFASVDMPEAEYTEKLIRTLDSLRKKLGDNLPIVIGELPREIFGDTAGPARMNALLGRIAGAVPNCDIASSEGLSVRGDNLHFNSASLRELGKRYAEKMIALIKK